MKVLLTGAGGAIGYEILKKLANKPEIELTIFDLPLHANKQKFKAFKDRVKIIYGDLSDEKSLLPATIEQDVVLHLGAVIPPIADDYPILAYRANVLGTKNLVHLLELFSPEAHIIYSSSVAVYGDRLKNPWIKVTDPLHPAEGDHYAKTKILAEKIIRSSKLKWTIYRLSAIFGIKNHKLSKILFHVPLNTPMEITTVRDAANAFVKTLEHLEDVKFKIFNLGGGEKNRIIYRDFLDRSFEIYGLGKLDFPPEAFARQNYHCGYYADSDELEQILHFRQDTIETYFKQLEQSISKWQRLMTYMFHRLIKLSLLRKSEPLKALRRGDLVLIKRFFGTEFLS